MKKTEFDIEFEKAYAKVQEYARQQSLNNLYELLDKIETKQIATYGAKNNEIITAMEVYKKFVNGAKKSELKREYKVSEWKIERLIGRVQKEIKKYIESILEVARLK